MLLRRPLLILLALRSSGAFDFEDEEDSSAHGTSQPAFFGDEETGASTQLEHSFNGGPFSVRGKLFYRDSKQYAGATGGRASARVSQGKLSGEEVDGFGELLATGGYYTLRLPSVLNDPASPPVFASVSVCSLMVSRFEESLHLSMHANGRVAGLSYILPETSASCPTKGLPRLALDEALFNTTVTVHFPQEGPKPLGKVPDLGFLPPAAQAAAVRAGEGGEGGEGGQQQQQQQQQGSFLRKYWMYILPAVIMLTMGGGEEPKEGGKAPAAKRK